MLRDRDTGMIMIATWPESYPAPQGSCVPYLRFLSRQAVEEPSTPGLDVASLIPIHPKFLVTNLVCGGWLRRFLTTISHLALLHRLNLLSFNMGSISVASSRSSKYNSPSQTNLPSSISILSSSSASSSKVSFDLEDEGVSCFFYASIRISSFISCSREWYYNFQSCNDQEAGKTEKSRVRRDAVFILAFF